MTTSTLRPNATVTAGAVTGAANAHTALSDDSDASYVGTGTVNVLDLGTVTLPAGAVTKQARARARVGTTGSDIAFEVSWIIDGEQKLQLSGTAKTLAAFTSAYTAVDWSQTRIDGLQLKAAAAGGGTDAALRFYELYLDLVYVPIPVVAVTAVSPDPYTASNIVPIAWSNTLDADGGSQSRYWLKVFTAAQYGAGGFDPETSTAFYDSGNTVSSSTTTSTGVLDTGVTYRAYVKVAQTVNGVAHWSAWAYDQFAVDVDTADVDSVVAAGSASTASITVTVERVALSEAWAFMEVQRSTDGGTTWTPVRGATYVDATGDADTFTVIDYEVGNDVAVIYRARATRILSALPISGAWVESTPSASWSSSSCWLKAPDDPTLNTTFALLARDPYTRVRSHGVYQVIGAAAPVVVSDVLSRRSGVLTIETYEAQEAAALIAILDGAPVVLVQAPALFDVADFYAAIVDVVEVFVSTVADVVWRRWAATYVEVEAPADPAASAP